jgi:hypothetical protein
MRPRVQILTLTLLGCVLLTQGVVAADRQLVPYFVAIQDRADIPAWRDIFQRLEDEGAVALIRKPLKPGDVWTSRHFQIEGLSDEGWDESDYEDWGWLTEEAVIGRIETTLKQNLGDRLTEARRAELARLVYDAMKSSTWSHAPEVQVVERGGVTDLPLVFWHPQPDKPLVAKAGPGGDILLLGRFLVQYVEQFTWHRQTIVLGGSMSWTTPYYLAIIWREE